MAWLHGILAGTDSTDPASLYGGTGHVRPGCRRLSLLGLPAGPPDVRHHPQGGPLMNLARITRRSLVVTGVSIGLVVGTVAIRTAADGPPSP